ncbi:MAG: hypothetical protein ACI8RO_000681 [Flavobacteriales bacterium]|jgi:hypothetical protein
MRASVNFTKVLLLSAALLLPGCALQQWQVNSITDQLQQGRPELALSAMQALEPSDRDKAQYLLNLGMLKHLNGDIEGSITDLQTATALMELLQAISVREALSAATVNETLRAYPGSPAEQILAQQLLALNYLALGDLDGARVEILKADVLMRQPVYDDKIVGQLASARMIAGLVYELGTEWDNALISYRRAANLMTERGHTLPPALQDSLLRMTKRVGISDEYQQYVNRFGRDAYFPKSDEAEVIAIYWQGLVSPKEQARISIYAPGLDQFVSIAVPRYRNSRAPMNESLLSVGQYKTSTKLLESVDELVREDLDAAMPKINATTLVRVVAKQQMVTKARKKNEKNDSSAFAVLAIITEITANLTEIADVRSWNTLPSNIQIARITVPVGNYPIMLGRNNVAPISSSQAVDNSAAGNQDTSNSTMLNLAKGQKAIILGNSLGTQLYNYKTR